METLLIEQIFKKNIKRNINGVVQAGQVDLETMKIELEEYVMTDEGTRYIKAFYKYYLALYQRPSTDMGVWISGFFGSGKSHFLKILSYLLDNQEVAGKRPVDYFLDKTDDHELLDMMQKVAGKPSDAVLFNIDAKSSSSASNKERIVEVFLRVFNIHLGYSDTIWVADIERQLESEGIYSSFEDEIFRVTGSPWEEIRLKIRLKRKEIIRALVNLGVDEESAKQFLTSAKDSLEMTADKLADLIANYCQNRGPDYRLVFLADEVGQYIGTDSDLMLNLQTVVERIGNATMGQAWVIVTSQEKIESAINLKSTDDFSKIQGRFVTRINLSSANTDEVLKRRLLEKTETAAASLTLRYDQEEQMIRNRLSFEPGTTQLRMAYRTNLEFVELYPFVPYQVELLKEVFHKIRTQGEGGAHLAHGERSLLKAFQEACLLKAEQDTTHLVTMADFYPSIRNFLDSSITSTIVRAEDLAHNHEGLQDFDVEVLIVLYMIKGIEDIKATANNVATLLMPNLHYERLPLENGVKEALSRLEQTRYIEQHADQTYSFLSDEEQEINREIHNEPVDPGMLKELLGKMFFDKIYTKVKISYDKKEFDYNKRFDNYVRTTMTHSLTVQVYGGQISDSEAALKSNEGVLAVCLDPERIAEAEGALKYVKQILSYTTRKKSSSTTPSQQRIYDAKINQIEGFEKKAEHLMGRACEKSRFFIQSQERNFNGTFENKLTGALDMLVRNTYTKLTYLDQSITYKDYKQAWISMVTGGLQATIEGMENGNAYEEVKLYMEGKGHSHEKVALKGIIDKFSAVPFGWNEYDTIALVLALYHDVKVKLTYAGDSFTPTHPNFYDRLSKQQERDRILVSAVKVPGSEARRKLFAIFREYFGNDAIGDSYEEMGSAIKEALNDKFIKPLGKIEERRKSATGYAYPGEGEISRIKMGTNPLLSLSDDEDLVSQFIQAEDQVDEWLEELNTLNSFYERKPIEYFDSSVELLKKFEQDISLINDRDINYLKLQIDTILTSPKPYQQIPNLPLLQEQLKTKLSEHVETARQRIGEQVEGTLAQNQELIDYYVDNEPILVMLSEGQRTLEQLKERIVKETSMLTIRSLQLECNEQVKHFAKKASKMEALQKLEIKEKAPYQPTGVYEKPTRALREKDLYNLFFNSRQQITTLDELDDAIKHLRTSLMEQLKVSNLKKSD
ncbi:BREX system P-loop protein BrxC [Desulfosporosinus metallidurans]|uniref:ATPase-like protein n=1 Tax=Desulfosporosinus metallidurans TaxID=1888891 RepID=A0A1Q8QSM5_9FIRM|nr:BREX system P-loop protein BrxC [Desulfosporosinus metallidurans]OLN30349.1 ATPase-like protein [Desulfosporosinus metallidurans]